MLRRSVIIEKKKVVCLSGIGALIARLGKAEVRCVFNEFVVWVFPNKLSEPRNSPVGWSVVNKNDLMFLGVCLRMLHSVV